MKQRMTVHERGRGRDGGGGWFELQRQLIAHLISSSQLRSPQLTYLYIVQYPHTFPSLSLISSRGVRSAVRQTTHNPSPLVDDEASMPLTAVIDMPRRMSMLSCSVHSRASDTTR